MLTLGTRRIRAAEHASVAPQRPPLRRAGAGHRRRLPDRAGRHLRGRCLRTAARSTTGPGPGLVELGLPGAAPVKLSLVRTKLGEDPDGQLVVARGSCPATGRRCGPCRCGCSTRRQDAVSDLPAAFPAAACDDALAGAVGQAEPGGGGARPTRPWRCSMSESETAGTREPATARASLTLPARRWSRGRRGRRGAADAALLATDAVLQPGLPRGRRGDPRRRPPVPAARRPRRGT